MNEYKTKKILYTIHPTTHIENMSRTILFCKIIARNIEVFYDKYNLENIKKDIYFSISIYGKSICLIIYDNLCFI